MSTLSAQEEMHPWADELLYLDLSDTESESEEEEAAAAANVGSHDRKRLRDRERLRDTLWGGLRALLTLLGTIGGVDDQSGLASTSDQRHNPRWPPPIDTSSSHTPSSTCTTTPWQTLASSLLSFSSIWLDLFSHTSTERILLCE